MTQDLQDDMRQTTIARFRQFRADGNLLGCIAVLSRPFCRAADLDGADAILAALDRPDVLASILRQCVQIDPTIEQAYEHKLDQVRAAHQNASAIAPECFVQCVTFKGLLRDGVHPIIHNTACFLGDHFGRQSAAGYFGGALPATRMTDAAAYISLGGTEFGFAADDLALQKSFAMFFLFEPGILRWISGFGARDVFLDIGANLGKYTIVAAKVRGCRTVAVEPFSVNYDALRENIRLNALDDRVSAHRLAIWDRSTEGKLSFQDKTVGVAAQAFHTPGSQSDDRDEEGRFEEVRAARLDDLIADGTLPTPTHIKIDVDGEEWRLIDGMANTLADARLKSIRVEMRDSQENRRAVGLLQSAGFAGAVDDDAKNLLFVRR